LPARNALARPPSASPQAIAGQAQARRAGSLASDKFVNRQSSIANHQAMKGGIQMALMRAFAKVDKEGKIPIPDNIRREVDLKEGQMVEIKVSGPNRAQFIVIHKRQSAR